MTGSIPSLSSKSTELLLYISAFLALLALFVTPICIYLIILPAPGSLAYTLQPLLGAVPFFLFFLSKAPGLVGLQGVHLRLAGKSEIFWAAVVLTLLYLALSSLLVAYALRPRYYDNDWNWVAVGVGLLAIIFCAAQLVPLLNAAAFSSTPRTIIFILELLCCVSFLIWCVLFIMKTFDWQLGSMPPAAANLISCFVFLVSIYTFCIAHLLNLWEYSELTSKGGLRFTALVIHLLMDTVVVGISSYGILNILRKSM